MLEHNIFSLAIKWRALMLPSSAIARLRVGEEKEGGVEDNPCRRSLISLVLNGNQLIRVRNRAAQFIHSIHRATSEPVIKTNKKLRRRDDVHDMLHQQRVAKRLQRQYST